MLKHLGEHEWSVSGETKSNEFIKALFKHTDYGDPGTDKTPWCAACVSAALEETGCKSMHSAAAIAYAKYGTPCALTPGCIVVLQTPEGGHHVAFLDHVVDSTAVVLLGGNQAKALARTVFHIRDGQHYKIIYSAWPIPARIEA